MNYVHTPEAEAELLEAAPFYAQNVSIAVAENFLATFEQNARLIAEFPEIGTPSAQRLTPVAAACFQSDLNAAFVPLLRQAGTGVKVGNTRLKGVRRQHLGRIRYFVYCRVRVDLQ